MTTALHFPHRDSKTMTSECACIATGLVTCRSVCVWLVLVVCLCFVCMCWCCMVVVARPVSNHRWCCPSCYAFNSSWVDTSRYAHKQHMHYSACTCIALEAKRIEARRANHQAGGRAAGHHIRVCNMSVHVYSSSP